MAGGGDEMRGKFCISAGITAYQGQTDFLQYLPLHFEEYYA